MAEQGKFEGRAAIDHIVDSLVESIRSGSKSFDKAAGAVYSALGDATERGAKQAKETFAGFGKTVADGLGGTFKRLTPQAVMETKSLFDAINGGMKKGRGDILTTLTSIKVGSNAVMADFFKNMAKYRMQAAILSAPLAAAIDLAYDLRRVSIESADVMGAQYSKVAHVTNAMTANVSMSQAAAVQLVSSLSELGILANKIDEKDFVPFAIHLGVLTDVFGYNADAMVKNYAQLDKLGVTMRGYINITREAFTYGKIYNLSLREQERALGLVSDHMAKMGKVGDGAARAMTQEFVKAISVFKSLNLNIDSSLQSLNKLSDFSDGEVIGKYTMIAAYTKTSTEEAMRLYRDNMSEFVLLQNQAMVNWAGNYTRHVGGFATILDNKLGPIMQGRLNERIKAQFGEDKVEALTSITAKVAKDLGTVESHYASIGKLSEFRANRERIIERLYTTQMDRLKEQMEVEAKSRKNYADFDETYQATKATTTELLGKIKNVGHALLVTIGTPMLKVFSEVLQLVAPIVDLADELVTSFSSVVSGSEEWNVVIAGIMLGLTGLLMPFLQIPIVIGLGIVALDKMAKAAGMGGLAGILRKAITLFRQDIELAMSDFETMSDLIENFIWLPLQNAGNALVWAIKKALSLMGLGKDPGKLVTQSTKSYDEIMAGRNQRNDDIRNAYREQMDQASKLNQDLIKTVKGEGYEDRKQQSKLNEGLTKAVAGLTDSDVAPFAADGSGRRLGSVGSAGGATRGSMTPAESGPLPGGMKGLLEQISRGEGTSDAKARQHGFASGYDVTLGYGKFNKKTDKPLSQMTIGEVKRLQAEILRNSGGLNSSAVGKYQIVGKTLRGLQRNMGIDDNAIFDEKMQDAMAVQLLKGRGLNRFMSGKMSRAQFQGQLYHEWASIADPYTKRGKQGTGSTDEQMQAALAGLKSGGSTQVVANPAVNKPTATADAGTFAADAAARQEQVRQQQAATAARMAVLQAPAAPVHPANDTNKRLDKIIEQQAAALKGQEEHRQLSIIRQAKAGDDSVSDLVTTSTI